MLYLKTSFFIFQKCYTPIKHGIDLSASDFVALCPKILFALTQECIKDDDHQDNHDDHDDHDDSDKPPTSEGMSMEWKNSNMFM